MLIPQVSCKIEQATKRDLYGKESLSKPFFTWCSIVRLINASEQSSVRADSSASRGKADEITSQSRILFKPNESISMGDKVTVGGLSLEVSVVHQRYDVRGRLDHLQVDLDKWAK